MSTVEGAEVGLGDAVLACLVSLVPSMSSVDALSEFRGCSACEYRFATVSTFAFVSVAVYVSIFGPISPYGSMSVFVSVAGPGTSSSVCGIFVESCMGSCTAGEPVVTVAGGPSRLLAFSDVVSSTEIVTAVFLLTVVVEELAIVTAGGVTVTGT